MADPATKPTRDEALQTRTRILARRERYASAHNFLLRASQEDVKAATASQPGSFYRILSALVMSALALEALCNAVGDQIDPNWKDFESANPIAKLRIICKALDITYVPDDEPWATVRWLYKFRNKIAHAKPELVTQQVLCRTDEEVDKKFSKWLESAIERDITLPNARRAAEGIGALRDLLGNKLPVEQQMGITLDGWTGERTLHHLPDE